MLGFVKSIQCVTAACRPRHSPSYLLLPAHLPIPKLWPCTHWRIGHGVDTSDVDTYIRQRRTRYKKKCQSYGGGGGLSFALGYDRHQGGNTASSVGSKYGIVKYGNGMESTLTFPVKPSTPPKSSAVFPGRVQYPAALDLLVNQISPTLPSGRAAIVYTIGHKLRGGGAGLRDRKQGAG